MSFSTERCQMLHYFDRLFTDKYNNNILQIHLLKLMIHLLLVRSGLNCNKEIVNVRSETLLCVRDFIIIPQWQYWHIWYISVNFMFRFGRDFQFCVGHSSFLMCNFKSVNQLRSFFLHSFLNSCDQMSSWQIFTKMFDCCVRWYSYSDNWWSHFR